MHSRIFTALITSTLFLQTASATLSPLHLSFEQRGRLNFAPHQSDMIVETIRAQAAALDNVRRLVVIVEGRSRQGAPAGNEKVSDVVKNLNLRFVKTRRIIDGTLLPSPPGMARFAFDDFTVHNRDRLLLRATIEDNHILDQFRFTLCGSQPPAGGPCDAMSSPRGEDLHSGDPIGLEPQEGVQGAWVRFRPARKS